MSNKRSMIIWVNIGPYEVKMRLRLIRFLVEQKVWTDFVEQALASDTAALWHKRTAVETYSIIDVCDWYEPTKVDWGDMYDKYVDWQFKPENASCRIKT